MKIACSPKRQTECVYHSADKHCCAHRWVNQHISVSLLEQQDSQYSSITPAALCDGWKVIAASTMWNTSSCERLCVWPTAFLLSLLTLQRWGGNQYGLGTRIIKISTGLITFCRHLILSHGGEHRGSQIEEGLVYKPHTLHQMRGECYTTQSRDAKTDTSHTFRPQMSAVE